MGGGPLQGDNRFRPHDGRNVDAKDMHQPAHDGAALGAQAGEAKKQRSKEAKIIEVAVGGGFTKFRRATRTPTNMVFEVRP